VRRTLAGERCHFELESVRKDGTPIHVEVRTIPIQHRGKPHVLAIARDVTGRRAAEAERAQLEKQLRQARRWRRSATSRAASRTTSTTSCRAFSAT
jgi:PAS domain-containing protein